MRDRETPPTSHTVDNQPDAIADKSQDTNESVRRLLLYEVLLEEYETHRQPPHDESSPPQPELVDQNEIKEIIEEGKQEKRNLRGISDDGEREREETRFNGNLVARVYDLMRGAQQTEAKGKVNELREKYEQEYAEFGADSNERQELVEWAITADIYGVTEDLRDQCRRKYHSIQDKEERHRTIEKDVLEALKDKKVIRKIRRAEQKSTDEPATDGGTAGNGSSSTNRGNASANEGGEKNGGDKAVTLAEKAYARTLRSALCLSGGGIRSATFNLGILQGLARHGLLDKFDYLSTVSGGGFIGSWLTAWMHRRGTREVIRELSSPPPSPLTPDPHPIDHLRVYSNYLSPQPGLLSADTWTLLATMLRNLLLTWLVFVPILMAVLIVPRFWTSFVFRQILLPGSALTWSFLIGFIAAGWAFTYAGISLPSSKKGAPALPSDSRKGRQGRFLWFCLLPMVIAAAAFATYLARLNQRPTWHYWGDFVWFAVALIAIPWVITFVYRIVHTPRSQRSGRLFGRIPLATALIFLAQFVAGCLLWRVSTTILFDINSHPRLYATFSVPMFLLLLAVGCTLIAGFTSRFTKDDDQEWWARSCAWFLIVIVIWSAVHLLVLYGPSMLVLPFIKLQQAWAEGSLQWDDLSWKNLGQLLGVLVGIISGIISLFGGFSAKTPVNEAEAKESGIGGKVLQTLTSLVAPIFLGFVIILMSLGTNWLLTSGFGLSLDRAVGWLLSYPGRLLNFFGYWLNFKMISYPALTTLPPPTDHELLVTTTPLHYLIVIGVFLALVSLVMGSLINTNAFSLHYMWRNRIIRAYLGASRRKRNQNPFTGFDTDDNIPMHELRPQPPEAYCARPAEPVERPGSDQDERPSDYLAPRKLFHVLNIALNLAGGDKLIWQDRKAESFTISPLHAGSYWLGYRRSCRYGYVDKGISLGTAVAISGAFVSPNMGYMMTSPVVRFLMTLFNVRFGWWLGNPGAAGGDLSRVERAINRIGQLFGRRIVHPFELRSPLLPIRPIIAEAFGMTNDSSPYVYLSDGGHFENLGLYEMVIRRCRFIVVSDASTDAGYSFDSLAQAIRQIRVDLGVPIDIREMSIIKPAQDMRGKYCAIGNIRYSCVDWKPNDPRFPEHKKLKAEDFDGTLIYIKASMVGDEPRDVINYGQGSKSFPQEIIVDQWFSEAQFESYRALGSHIIDVICSGDSNRIDDQNKISLAAFERKAKEHNRMNFRIFKEQINYTAFVNQFKQIMRYSTPQAYKDKVKQYLEDIVGR